MTDFMNSLASRLSFPEEAVKSLETDFGRIAADCENVRIFDKYRTEFLDDSDDTRSMCEGLERVAKNSGVHIYSVHFLFLMYCAEALHEKYAANGLPENMYFDLMNDLKCKLIECRDVHGVWGTFVFDWYFHHHFALKLFALGRFQYEKRDFCEEHFEGGGVTLNKGDTVLGFHIPSSGPMTREMRLDSYKRAYDFFGDGKSPVVITCGSWLIYPENKNIYPEGSNLSDFIDDFRILESVEKDEFGDAWRVFGRDYNGSTEGFPKKTTLQRNFAEWLDAGKKTGWGYGVIVFDGEKIVRD